MAERIFGVSTMDQMPFGSGSGGGRGKGGKQDKETQREIGQRVVDSGLYSVDVGKRVIKIDRDDKSVTHDEPVKEEDNLR